MGRASPPPLPTNPPCAAKAAAPTITAPAASDIHFILPAIFSLPASLHIVETEGLARPDGLGPGLAVPEVNIEQMVELRGCAEASLRGAQDGHLALARL